MFLKDKNGLFYSDIFDTRVTHGFAGRRWGDMREEENRRKMFETIGEEGKKLILLHQVHGDTVVFPESEEILEGDALVTKDRMLVLGIKTADCAPILFADPENGVIAAVHSGWRGTLSDIAGKTVGRMVDAGARIDHIRAAIGPRIGGCCYTVDRDRREAYRTAYPGSVVGKNSIDLGLAIKDSLVRAGVTHIDMADICTATENGKFFSYRKDTDDKGMNLSFIGFA